MCNENIDKNNKRKEVINMAVLAKDNMCAFVVNPSKLQSCLTVKNTIAQAKTREMAKTFLNNRKKLKD